jgi:hypothetical protein
VLHRISTCSSALGSSEAGMIESWQFSAPGLGVLTAVLMSSPVLWDIHSIVRWKIADVSEEISHQSSELKIGHARNQHENGSKWSSSQKLLASQPVSPGPVCQLTSSRMYGVISQR